MRRLLVVALLAVGVGAAAADTMAPVLNEQGVGGLKMGRTLAAIKADHLIGPTTPGCELASPRPVVAQLKAPLRGSATFSKRNGVFRLSALVVTAGARTDRGVKIGDTGASVLKAYPGSKPLNQSTSGIVIHAIVVKRAGVDRIWFMLNRKAGTVRQFALPTAQICE